MQDSDTIEIKETILIVDDKEINRAILCETFKNEYKIVEASRSGSNGVCFKKH